MASSPRINPAFMSMRQTGKNKKAKREIPAMDDVPATVSAETEHDPVPTTGDENVSSLSSRPREPIFEPGVIDGFDNQGGTLDDPGDLTPPPMTEDEMMTAMSSVIAATTKVTEHTEKVRNAEKTVMEAFDARAFSNEALLQIVMKGAIEFGNRRKAEEEERRKRDEAIQRALRQIGIGLPRPHGTAAAALHRRGGKPEKKRIPQFICVHPDDPSLTWAGMGQRPDWLRDWIRNHGDDLTSLKVENPAWTRREEERHHFADTETESG